MLAGSLLIYCGQAALGDPDAVDGDTPDAEAQTAPTAQPGTSCASCPIEAPSVLFDGPVTPELVDGACLGPELDVSAFRTIVVHATIPWGQGTCPGGGACWAGVAQKHGSAAGFVTTVWLDGTVANHKDIKRSVRVDPRDGGRLRLFLGMPESSGPNQGMCAPTPTNQPSPTAATIVGYKT